MAIQTELGTAISSHSLESHAPSRPAFQEVRPHLGEAYEKAAVASFLIEQIGVQEILQEFNNDKLLADAAIEQVTSFINKDQFHVVFEGSKQDKQYGTYNQIGVLSGYQLTWEDTSKPWLREGVKGYRHYTLLVGIADLATYNCVALWNDDDEYVSNWRLYDAMKETCPITIDHSGTTNNNIHVPLIGYNGKVCTTEGGIEFIRNRTHQTLQSFPSLHVPVKPR